jgi:hypothetical protein
MMQCDGFMQHFPRLTNGTPLIPTTYPQQFTSGTFHAEGLSLTILKDSVQREIR